MHPTLLIYMTRRIQQYITCPDRWSLPGDVLQRLKQILLHRYIRCTRILLFSLFLFNERSVDCVSEQTVVVSLSLNLVEAQAHSLCEGRKTVQQMSPLQELSSRFLCDEPNIFHVIDYKIRSIPKIGLVDWQIHK